MQISSMDIDGVLVHFKVSASDIALSPWSSLALRFFRLGNKLKLLPIDGIGESGRDLIYELLSELTAYGSFCRRRKFPLGMDAFGLRLLAARGISARVQQMKAAGIRTQWARDPSGGIYLELRKTQH